MSDQNMFVVMKLLIVAMKNKTILNLNKTQ